MKSFEEIIEHVSSFRGLTDDSRKVKKGYIFVAIKGINHDGHDYIKDALKKGASLVIGEENLQINHYLMVSDSRDALGKIASAWYGNPSKKLKIIGVTGTKGKTTTCYLIHHILTKLGRKSGLVTSIAAKIGKYELSTGFHVTSPNVVSLHELLAKMVKRGLKYAVIEVSSHGIDQKRIAGVEFDIGVLTNIAPEHLDYHKTFEEYQKIKKTFIKSCKQKIVAPKKTNLHILPGKFNNLDAEAAIGAVKMLGISRKDAIVSLSSFELPEGRLMRINNNLGIHIYIDFAHTPESLEAVLKYLRTKTKGRLISVFGCAGERDPYKRPKMGKIASKISDEVILTAEDPRSEEVEKIITNIRAGMDEKFKNVNEIPDREEAIKFAIKMANKGDLVAILGKGHEKSMNLDGIHETPWSDKKVVEKII